MRGLYLFPQKNHQKKILKKAHEHNHDDNHEEKKDTKAKKETIKTKKPKSIAPKSSKIKKVSKK